jgi:hypothetical protein
MSKSPTKNLGVTDEESAFTQKMRDSRSSGEPAEAVLRTDDRVLARITDGIYRQPSSALRELISNAYDADATQVVIDTDAPRFSRIDIRDNGRGMDEQALSRLIHHIGGSSKRTSYGASVGTTDPTDPTLSPGGRRLIGKIGIGLFSVKQLTSNFQIITKIKGTNYRLFADVILKTYNEDTDEGRADEPYETGSVKVYSVPAQDLEAHGTQIILRRLNPRARNILMSRERWDRIFEQQSLDESERDPAITIPIYHSGVFSKEPDEKDGELVFRIQPHLPWESSDKPLQRFEKLRKRIADQAAVVDRPELAKTFDTYLSTLWTLSLSAPVEYAVKHPFDLTLDDDAQPFRLTDARGRAQPLALSKGQTIRDAADLTENAAAIGGFSVVIDGVELRRPISFEWWPSERQAIKTPLMFVGNYSPDLSKVPTALRGGDLEFEGYLFWNSKVVPKENNGVLVRINGASGALFDDTFMKYQVSEQTRLRQITAEIFVTKGMDAALNIDRESFNFAHPHYILMSNWLHRALRQLANTQKSLSEVVRTQQSEETQRQSAGRIEDFSNSAWRSERRNLADAPPVIELAANAATTSERRAAGAITFDRTRIQAVAPPSGKNSAQQSASREQQLKAVATILDAFGVLDSMEFDEQHRLLDAILTVFFLDARS